MTRVIVCGKCDFTDYELLKNKLDHVLAPYQDVEIVSGGARGADTLGERYANENKLPCKRFPAEWKKYGKAAGPARNTQMVDYARLAEKSIVVAFWDGVSRGTSDTIKKAEEKGIECMIISI